MDMDPEFARLEKERALRDPIRFFTMHAWTHEPRPEYLRLYGLTRPTLPFLLYEYQEKEVLDLVERIKSGRDLLVEKSRDMGFTWLVLTVFLWFWLQSTGGNDFLLGSYKFDEVDCKGNLKTLFEKLRYNLYLLHPVFLPEGFNNNQHDKIANLINPATQSFIEGEHCTADFSRSGRYRAILLDEFAFWEHQDEEAWTATGDSSLCRVVVSTPGGFGRYFSKLRFSGAIDVLSFHWTLHPLKNIGLYKDTDGKPRSIWYDEQCERRKDNIKAIAQELDIDHLMAGSPYFDNLDMQRRLRAAKEWEAAREGANTKVRPYRFKFEKSGYGANVKIKLLPYQHGEVVVAEPPALIKSWLNRYLITTDVAEGLEKGDFSYFVVFDRVLGRDVAWYHGHCDTDVLAFLLAHFGRWYDNAYIAPEKNNHGHAVIATLKEIYPFIMRQYEYDLVVETPVSPDKLGWVTNQVTRSPMLSNLRKAVREGTDGVYDPGFFNECLTFVYNKNGKPEAEEGNYDDRVMAQAIKFRLHEWLPAPVRKKARETVGRYDDYGMVGKRSWQRGVAPRPKGADGV